MKSNVSLSRWNIKILVAEDTFSDEYAEETQSPIFILTVSSKELRKKENWEAGGLAADSRTKS
jgi:hypothetical protein